MDSIDKSLKYWAASNRFDGRSVKSMSPLQPIVRTVSPTIDKTGRTLGFDLLVEVNAS